MACAAASAPCRAACQAGKFRRWLNCFSRPGTESVIAAEDCKQPHMETGSTWASTSAYAATLSSACDTTFYDVSMLEDLILEEHRLFRTFSMCSQDSSQMPEGHICAARLIEALRRDRVERQASYTSFAALLSYNCACRHVDFSCWEDASRLDADEQC